MNETRFYICQHCGNIVGMINHSGVPIMCCGEPMTKMEAGTSDASAEKHVPVVQCTENEVVVNVGSVRKKIGHRM